MGAAAAITVASPIAKAAASASSLGGYRVRSKKGKGKNLDSVSVELHSGCEWRLDRTLFEGNPKLEAIENANGFAMRLTGARYPGTQFEMNLEVRVSQKLVANTIEFTFTNTGVNDASFKMKAPLAEWLQGKKEAKVKLTHEQATALLSHASFFEHSSLMAFCGGTLVYRPDGFLAFRGETGLENDGHEYRFEDCEFGVRPRDESTFVAGRNRSATLFSGTPLRLADQNLSLASVEGWHVAGDASSFQKIAYEAHEHGQAAIMALGGSELKAHMPGHAEFDLENAQLAKLLGERDDLLFVADMSPDGVWVHQPGLSVEVGAQQGQPLIMRLDRRGNLIGGPQLEARNVAPVIDNAIVTVPDFEPRPVLLVPQTPPKTGVVQTKPITLQKPPASLSQISVAKGPIAIFLRPFALTVTRPEDMLTLEFDFVNLRFGSSNDLSREDANKPAYVVVGFPAQSMVEQDFAEGPSDSQILLPGGFRAPISAYLSHKSKLCFFIPSEVTSIKLTLGDDGGLLDWSKWTLAVAPTAISSYGPHITINPNWEHPINVGALPAGRGLLQPPHAETQSSDTIAKDKETETLMLYREQGVKTLQQTSQAVRAIGKLNPVMIVHHIPTGPEPLHEYDTQIVMPHGLTISPDERAKWFHIKAGDITTEGSVKRAALWHTHLGSYLETSRGGESVVEASDDGKWYYTDGPGGRQGPFASSSPIHSSIRVIGLPDLGNTYNVGVMTLDRRAGVNRHDPKPFLNQRPDASKPVELGFIDVMTSRTASFATDSTPFIVDRLMLTGLGGYLKGEWTYLKGHQPLGTGGGPALSGWKHISTLGRDHFIKVVERGFLYPTMHQAVKVTISERKFQHDPASKAVYAVLRTRVFIVVKQPTVTYSGTEGRALGFQSITVVTKETPILDPAIAGQNEMWLYSNGPVKLVVRGVDYDGNVVSWLQHMGWVHWDYATQASPALTISCVAPTKNVNQGAYQGPVPSDLGGQNVAWATPAPHDAKNPKKREGGTTFPCESLVLGANNSASFDPKTGLPKFRPRLGGANIRVPQLEHFQAGASGGPGSTLLASVDPDAFESVDEWADAAAEYAAGDGAGDRLGPVLVQFAEGFLNSSSSDGFGGDNPSQTLFGFVDKAKAMFNDTSKSGGVVSPNMNVNALSRMLGPIADAALGSSSSIDTSRYDASGGKLSDLGDAAKLLGVVNIWSLLPDKINLVGDGEKVPQVFLKKVFEDDKSDSGGGGSNGPSAPMELAVADDKKVIGIAAGIQWTPKLGNWGFNSAKPIFIGTVGNSTFWRVDPTDASSDSIKPFKDSEKHSSDFDKDATLHLEASVTYLFDPSTDEADDKKKKDSSSSGGGSSGGASSSGGDSKSPSFGDHFKFELLGQLKFFRVNAIAGAASVVLVDVELIEFKLESGSNLKLTVDIPNITFVGPLSFVQKLEDFLGGGSNSVHFPGKDSSSSGGGSELASIGEDSMLPVGSGFELKPFFNVDMSGLTVGFTLGIPDISIGVFAIRNISFTATVTLPWIGEFWIGFQFCSRDNPFALSVWCITGGGFFGIQLCANGLKMIEAALEFGASISLNLGVASGSVSLMAGIYYKLDNSSGQSVTTLTGYVKLHGELDILGGLISMSLEFDLSLTYTSSASGSKVEGDATLTVSISILFFSVSVSMSVHKEFAGSGNPPSSLLSAGIAGALPEPTPSAVLFTTAVSNDNWNAYCEAFGAN